MNKIKIYPPLFALLLILTMVALHYTLPQPQLISPPINALGFILIAGGMSMNLWSAAWFRKKRTTIDPHGNAIYLAQEGLYRVSRNPMYLGITTAFLGLGLAFASPWLFVLTPVMAIALRKLAIEREERHLEARFGDAYRAYRRQVRRWL